LDHGSIETFENLDQRNANFSGVDHKVPILIFAIVEHTTLKTILATRYPKVAVLIKGNKMRIQP